MPKISDLQSAADLQPDDLVALEQAAGTRKLPVQSIAALAFQNLPIYADNAAAYAELGAGAAYQRETGELAVTYGVGPEPAGLALDTATGDWYNATAEPVSGADSYRWYRNTTNNSGTAELIGETVSNTWVGIPLLAGETNYIWSKSVDGGIAGAFVAVGNLSIPNIAFVVSTLGDGDSNMNTDDPAYQPNVTEELETLLASDARYSPTVANIGVSGARASDGVVQGLYKAFPFILANPNAVKVAFPVYGTNDLNSPSVPWDSPDTANGYTVSLIDNLAALHAKYHSVGVNTIAVSPGERGHLFSNPPNVATYTQFAPLGDWMEEHYKDILGAAAVLNLEEDPLIGKFLDPQYLPSPYNNLPYTTPGAGSSTANNAFYLDSLHYSGFVATNQLNPKLGLRYYASVLKPVLDEYTDVWRKQPPAPSVSIDTNARTATVTLRPGYAASDYEMTIDGGLTWSAFTTTAKSIGINSHEIGHLIIRIKAKNGNPHGLGYVNSSKIAGSESETWVPATNGAWSIPNDWAQVNGTGGTSPGNVDAFFPNTVSTYTRATFQFTKGFKFINFIDPSTLSGPYQGTPLGYRIYINNTLVKEVYGVVQGQLILSYEATPGNTTPIDCAIQCTWAGSPYTSKGAVNGAYVSGLVVPGMNYALATNGGTATAGNTYNVGTYSPGKAIDGSLVTTPDFEANTCWRGGNTGGAYPNFLQVELSQVRSVTEVVIVSIREPLTYSQAPVNGETSQYAITNCVVEYKENSGDSWSTFGTVTSNTLVIKSVTHAAVNAKFIRLRFDSAGATNPVLEAPIVVELQVYGT